MNKQMFNKGLTSAVVSLFVLLAISSSINAHVSKISTDNELVEITIEICGIEGAKPHTVQLTQEEAQELENLFDTLKERLDGAEAREETVEIFNDALVSLDELSLLPENMSVEQAQRLVTARYQNQRTMRLSEEIYGRNKGSLDDNENRNCLIIGSTINDHFLGFGARFYYIFLLILAYLWGYAQEHDFKILEAFLAWIGYIFTGPLGLLYFIFLVFSHYMNPLPIGNIVGFGAEGYIPDEGPVRDPAHGWIYTKGANGIKSWNGSFWGNLPIPPVSIGWTHSYLGILGFIGIKLFNPSSDKNSYLGSALWVRIGSEPPDIQWY